MTPAIEIETRDGVRRIPLDKPRLTIGRLPGNDIVLPFVQISRYHAEIRQRGEDWWIQDLGSTNGLHVGRRTVREYLLAHNDTVLLAPTISLRFFAGANVTPKTVEGTLHLPTIQLPVKPATDATPEPFVRPVDVIAAQSAMPQPRRRFSGSPPPATAGATSSPEEVVDDWLNDQAAIPQPPRGITPPPVTHPLSSGRAPQNPLPLQTPFGLMRQRNAPNLPQTPVKKPLLYTCPTCGERTAPDSPYCWNCRESIALPCRVCNLYLLPIQQTCPRCSTPNDHAIKRPDRTPKPVV